MHMMEEKQDNVKLPVLLCNNTTKISNATQSLHLETSNWWYVFAEYSTINATQR